MQMTLVHLIRRYKRWNPVHPTYGAFWGVGLGLGCGVGWGPGFGPEVVGFVGSGCGVGFSVGVTLIGVGIGLPSSGLTNLPWNALLWTGKGASHVTSNVMFPALAFTVHQSWEALAYQASALDRGIQNLYKIQIPRSREFIVGSRRRFLRRIQDSQRSVLTQEEIFAEPKPVTGLQDGKHSPTRRQSLSFSPRSQQRANSKFLMPTPSREENSLDLSDNLKKN